MMTACHSIFAEEFRANRAAICHVFNWTKRACVPEFGVENTLGFAAAPNACERELETPIKMGKMHISICRPWDIE